MSEILMLDNLTVGYERGAVLSDVDLRVQVGESICIIGRNGVGKTTLMKTIIGLLRPRRGALHFAGEDVTKLPPNARARRGMGYLPQGRMVFPYLTVRDNLLIGLEAAGAFSRAALDEVLDLFPVLGEMANRMAGTLSGGQQQQLAVGRALVGRPRLLLLDEPTEGIQPSIVQEIGAALRRVRRERHTAILLAEQFLDFASGLADHYYVLDGGAIALSTPASALDRAAVEDYLSV